MGSGSEDGCFGQCQAREAAPSRGSLVGPPSSGWSRMRSSPPVERLSVLPLGASATIGRPRTGPRSPPGSPLALADSNGYGSLAAAEAGLARLSLRHEGPPHSAFLWTMCVSYHGHERLSISSRLERAGGLGPCPACSRR